VDVFLDVDTEHDTDMDTKLDTDTDTTNNLIKSHNSVQLYVSVSVSDTACV